MMTKFHRHHFYLHLEKKSAQYLLKNYTQVSSKVGFMTFFVHGLTSFINHTLLKPSELHIAICRADEKRALEIIRSGAHFPMIEKGFSKISLAISNLPNMELIRKLVERADLAVINHIDQCGETALMGAANWGHHDIVRLLLEKGANPNLCDPHLNPPLSHAIIFKLWASKAENTPDENGERILKITKLLRKYGAAVDPVNSDGQTPLQAQVNEDMETIYPRVISYLIEEGADAARAVRTKSMTPEIFAKIDNAVQKGLKQREAKPILTRFLGIGDVVRSVLDYV